TLGFTLGNFIKGIRVRQYSNKVKRINIFQAILRYIFKIALGWLSFITIHSNPEKRAIHDFVSGSVMIKK
ncbi:MAG: RDD family protein, partial [Chitinophagaceae bacterium]